MRHFRSILYALVLAPAVWILCGVGFDQDLTGRARDNGGLESLTGMFLLLLAGAAYAILLFAPISPAGPLLAGAAFLGAGSWARFAPEPYAALWPANVAKPGFDLSTPGYGLVVLLAVPMICTALSARRWAAYEPPQILLLGTIGRVSGAARVAGPPMASERTTVLPGTPYPGPGRRGAPDATQVVPGMTQVVPGATQMMPGMNQAAPEATQIVRHAEPTVAIPLGGDENTTIVPVARPEEKTVAVPIARPDEETTFLRVGGSADETTVVSGGDGDEKAMVLQLGPPAAAPGPVRAAEPAPTTAAKAAETPAAADRANISDRPGASAEIPTEALALADAPTRDVVGVETPTSSAATREVAADDQATHDVAAADQPTRDVISGEAATREVVEGEAATREVVAAAEITRDVVSGGPVTDDLTGQRATDDLSGEPATLATVVAPGDGDEKTQVLRLPAPAAGEPTHDLAGTADGRGEATQVIRAPLPAPAGTGEATTATVPADEGNVTTKPMSIVGAERPDPGADPTTRLGLPAVEPGAATTGSPQEPRAMTASHLERPADEAADDTRPLVLPVQRPPADDDATRRLH